MGDGQPNRADRPAGGGGDGAGCPGTAGWPAGWVLADPRAGVWLYQADCLKFMDRLIAQFPDGVFPLIFADPPYFLSNGGITCQSGRMVRVDKGRWDRSRGAELNHQFNLEWLSRCQRLLTADGTIWVSGTQHVIHSVGFAMQQLGMKLLNDIVWEKPNPPPNLSCRYFAHSAETLIWAGRNKQTKHLFNYRLMKEINGGKQMKSVWRIAAPRPQEKAFGRHPTQKPVELLERIILASSREQDWVFDPFAGSATTGVAAVRCGRRFVGCELDGKAVELSRQRLQAEIATGYGGTAVG